ncbi:MAG: nucleotide exchange factor GrpE [Chloroflexota bacterium]|nr:MAG: protein GrpE [Bellilinea sp.]
MTEEKKKRTRHDHSSAEETAQTPPSAAEATEQETAAQNDAVSLMEDTITGLQQELQNAQNQCKEYFEGWQRERADFMNYKKRVERDQAQLHQVITANIIKKFLVVLDDMERAIKNRPADAEQQEWWNGVDLIYRKLQSILEAEGIQPIAAAGDLFDPNLHEAISHEESSEVQSGHIIEVVQQGYRLGDRVVRPALVRVAQ